VELDKNKEDPKGHRIETFGPVVVDKIKEMVREEIGHLQVLVPVDEEHKYHSGYIQLETIDFIVPKTGLDKLWVPLPELRMAIANEMQAGTVQLPVTDLLELIRSVYRENKG